MFNFPTVVKLYTRLSKSEVPRDDLADDKDVLLPHGLDAKFLRLHGRKSWISSGIVHVVIVCTELLLFVVLMIGYVKVSSIACGVQLADDSLDGLTRIATTYNTSMTFYNQSHLLRSSREADRYWTRLLESGGVVSLDTAWALGSGLKKSAVSPTDTAQSIYQVDIFHALHCMNAIRQMLMAPNPPPFDEKHMLHCLDYVRHELLCHPDLTLVTTNDLEEFVLEDTHKCKDYGAVLDWVDRHRWKEFPEWLKNKSAQGQ